MPHSTRIEVITHQGYRSFASRAKCLDLMSAQKGRFVGEKRFEIFPPDPTRSDGTAGEWRGTPTESGETLKYGTGPQFKTMQLERGNVRKAGK
jgi:hypothetical protein